MIKINSEEYVWYASYGSNLDRDRFLCYIRGGKPKGSVKTEVGCRDQSLPLKDDTHLLHFPLYFAKSSSRWQRQGVAFIGLTRDEKECTFSRKYLITKEQFKDVVKQENNGIELDINFEEVIRNEFRTLRDSWYGTILFVGEEEGIPIFTFTADWDLDVPFNHPSTEYLGMIIKGLISTLKLDPTEITDYLISKPGIHDYYNKDDLLKLVEVVSK